MVELTNGELLAAAEQEFDLLVTTDQNLRYQQNLSTRRIAILVLPTTSWPRIKLNLAPVIQAVNDAKPCSFIEVQFQN